MKERAGVEEIIRHHSKSFSLASRLLPADARADAVAVYAWCRRVDDAIDLAEPGRQDGALRSLQAELEAVYGGSALDDPVLRAFQSTVQRRAVPRAYARALLAGMAMDVAGRRYGTLDELLDYCYHVAGCVGLMMCHVMGLSDDSVLPNAAHLGIAMQLTNVCRDVAEDWERGRLYLPGDLLAEAGAPHLASRLGGPLPDEARRPVAHVIDRLLAEAERYYLSGDAGLRALPWRCAISIGTARAVYSAIGDRIRAQRCDPLRGRAFVSTGGKAFLALRAVTAGVTRFPARLFGARHPAVRPERVVRFPDDVLPLGRAGVAGTGARP